MNSILRTALILTFIVCLSGIYIGNARSASGGGCCGGGRNDKESSEKAEVVKDPVCGMEVSNIKKAPSKKYKGKIFYFCSRECKKTFKKSPASYTQPVALP